jgi:hypothetical protein
MANNWNPNAGVVLGNETFPTVGSSDRIAQSQPGLAQGFRSTATQTITDIELAVTSNPSVTDPLFTLWEVFTQGTEDPGTLQVIEYPPNVDETIGSWTDPLGGTTNLWSFIDDAVIFPPPVSNDYIITIGGGLTAYRASVDSSTFPLTARVSRLSVRAVVGIDPNRTTTLPRTFRLSLYHQPSGTVYDVPGNQFVNNGLAPNPIEVSFGEINPVTALPWCPTDVRSFDAGDWHIRITSTGTVACGAIVHSMSLKVSYWTTENREAVATWQRPSGVVSTIISSDALVEPDGAGGWATNWSKINATNYLLAPRWGRDTAISGGATPASDIAWLSCYQDLGDGGNPAGISYPSVPGLVSQTNWQVGAHGEPLQAFVGSSRRMGRFVLRTSAPADSDDSQPYTMEFSSNHLRTLDSATSIAQRLTTSGAANYLGVRLVVIPPATADATLTVRVFTTAGVQVGTGQFTITADEVRALPRIAGTELRYVEGFFTAAVALSAATAYDVRLDTSTTDDWLVETPYCYTGDASPSFGGTSNSLRVAGSAVADADAMVTILVQPSAPTNVRAETDAQPQGDESCFCRVGFVDQTIVRWTAPTPALGVSFARYEIERAYDTGDGTEPVWQPVATEDTEAVTFWVDYEGRRTIPAQYRIRAVATTAAFSDWVSTDWVTPQAYGCEVIFTSNADPALQVVYEREPGVTFGFLDHEADVLVPLLGRNYQVAFKETEDRGLSKRLTIIANFGKEPTDQAGRAMGLDAIWEPLRAISRAQLPYVCVLDHLGNVTYAHIQVIGGQNIEPAWRYTAELLITPVTGTPSVATS